MAEKYEVNRSNYDFPQSFLLFFFFYTKSKTAVIQIASVIDFES